MYYAQHTQTGETTAKTLDAYTALTWAESMGWEDCEVRLVSSGYGTVAEFPCTYSFHYGDEAHTCELTANRPDSLCPFHAGEED